MAFEEAIGLVLFGMMFTFAYIAVNMDKKNNFTAALQIFFLFMSMYVGIVAAAFAVDITAADASVMGILSGLYNVIIYMPIISAGIFILMFFYNIFAGNKKGKGKHEEPEEKGD